MKKSLLLIAAAAVAVSASAQKSAVETAVNANADVVASFADAKMHAEMATDAQRKAAKKVSAKATVSALYNRPAGSFYRSMTGTGGAYYSPGLILPCWRDVTYPNASTGDVTQYQWRYDKYDTSLKGWVSLTSGSKDLTDNFIQSSMDAPTLWVAGSNEADSSVYTLYADYYNSSSKENKTYPGATYYYTDPRATFMSATTPLNCYLTPKLFCAGARAKIPSFQDYGGVITLTAGAGEYWFGQNTKGWNGMALYVEKPATQYALRGIHVLYASEAITGSTPFEAKVYACQKDENDGLILGDVIATAQGTLAADAETVGFIDMPLIEYEEGLPYEVTKNIDQPIAVLFSGYDKVNAKEFRMMVSTDSVYEGYGQHGYMCKVDAEGYPTNVVGLDKFFTISLGCTAPTIFLDVEWPIMIWNYTFEDGKYAFPVAGGAWSKVVGSTSFDAISVYSTKSSDEWTISLEDGSDVPSWLKLEVADEVDENQEFSGEVSVKATAEALPAGVKGRAANVKFSVPGASLVYQFTQGDVAGINDVKAADATKAQKVVENGQIYILVGDKKYNVMGAEVK